MGRISRLLSAVAAVCALVPCASAAAGSVPINPFGRSGDIHVDFPTYAEPDTAGDNADPPEAVTRPVGDVNGDGRPDIGMAIWSHDSSWTSSVWVTFTPAALPWSADVATPGWNGLRIVGVGEVINGIAGIGDVNGDGFGDVAVAGTNAVWVVFGGPTSATVDVRELGTKGFTITGVNPIQSGAGGNLWTGVFSRTSSVEGIGDQNGDGRPDLAILDWEGLRFVFVPENPAAAVINVSAPDADSSSIDWSYDVGSAEIGVLGDIDGDGHTDLGLGWTSGGDGHVLGLPAPPPGSALTLAAAQASPRTFELDAPGDRFGDFNAIGDDNGDGRLDMAIELYAEGGRQRMIAYGARPGTHANLPPVSPTVGRSLEPMGSGISNVGDQNADGRADFATDGTVFLSGSGDTASLDAGLPGGGCVPIGSSGAVMLCSLEYKIVGALPDINADGKPEMIAIHTDPLPWQAGVTRATWKLDVFLSAAAPMPQAIQTPVVSADGEITFAGSFLTAPIWPLHTLAARPRVIVTSSSGHVTVADGDLVDAGMNRSTLTTVRTSARALGLVAGGTYSYRMAMENGRGLSGTSSATSFVYRPLTSTVHRGKKLRGTRRGDQLVGTPWGDTISGREGPDLILGLGGADRLSGGPGRDRLDGGAGNDVITGGSGPDHLRGREGRDVLEAADGWRDIVDCGRGVDRAVVDRLDKVIGCEHVSRRSVRR